MVPISLEISIEEEALVFAFTFYLSFNTQLNFLADFGLENNLLARGDRLPILDPICVMRARASDHGKDD